jgi:hypothetical protein
MLWVGVTRELLLTESLSILRERAPGVSDGVRHLVDARHDSLAVRFHQPAAQLLLKLVRVPVPHSHTPYPPCHTSRRGLKPILALLSQVALQEDEEKNVAVGSPEEGSR